MASVASSVLTAHAVASVGVRPVYYERDLHKLAVGLNIEGGHAAATCSSTQTYSGIWLVLDVPMGVLGDAGEFIPDSAITFDDVLRRRDQIYRTTGAFPALLEQTVGLDTCALVEQLALFIAIVVREGGHRSPLVHLHQYRAWTKLDVFIKEYWRVTKGFEDMAVASITFITDGTNFFEHPVDYAREYGDNDAIIAIGQIAGFGRQYVGTWVIPTELAVFDAETCTVQLPFKLFPRENKALKLVLDGHLDHLGVSSGPLLVVNGLWNPSADRSRVVNVRDTVVVPFV